MKKILIIGASILQLPAIQKAKQLGLYVGVLDYDPTAVGIEFADEYFNISTIDEQGVYRTAKDFKADGIMTLATDMPMRAIAYSCEQLGLIGISYDTAIKSTDKGEMIKVFEKNNVEHPWYYVLKNSTEIKDMRDKITYPCICKPTDNSGSRGVMLVKNEVQLYESFKFSAENGRSGFVLIEEFLQGDEVSVEIMVLNERVHVLQVTDKLTTGAPHFVEMGHSQPSQLPNEDMEKIKDLAVRAVKAVGITNGPAHVEIMLTKNGPKMIELGARMGGDCITTHLVPLSTGIDMVKATIQIALGETPDLTHKYKKGSAIRYFDPPCGVLKNISGVGEATKIDKVKEVVFVSKIGDIINELENSADRAGFTIAQGDDADEAIAICNEAIKKVRFEVQNEINSNIRNR